MAQFQIIADASVAKRLRSNPTHPAEDTKKVCCPAGWSAYAACTPSQLAMLRQRLHLSDTLQACSCQAGVCKAVMSMIRSTAVWTVNDCPETSAGSVPHQTTGSLPADGLSHFDLASNLEYVLCRRWGVPTSWTELKPCVLPGLPPSAPW